MNLKNFHRIDLVAKQIEDVTNAYNKNKEDSGLLPVAELGTALRMLGHVLDKEGKLSMISNDNRRNQT